MRQMSCPLTHREMESMDLVKHYVKGWGAKGRSLAGGSITAGSVDRVFEIKEIQTALSATLATYRTTVSELFLLLFLQSWRATTGENDLFLEVEKHGRNNPDGEMPDIDRTLGWFTVFELYMVKFCSGGLPAQIAGLKDQIRKPLFDAFRYTFLKDVSRQIPNMDYVVRFNYLGVFNSFDNQFFKVSNWKTGDDIHPENRPTCRLEFNCWTVGSDLFVRMRYNTAVYDYLEMIDLLNRFQEQLTNLPQTSEYNGQ
jgi:non-ribosomal peptide synthase protein (TIGR01720 family)